MCPGFQVTGKDTNNGAPDVSSQEPQNPRVLVGLRMLIIGVRHWGVTICLGVQETEVLVGTLGCLEGRGWTSNTPGHLHTSSRFCRVHVDVIHGGLGRVCELSVLLPVRPLYLTDSPLGRNRVVN